VKAGAELQLTVEKEPVGEGALTVRQWNEAEGRAAVLQVLSQPVGCASSSDSAEGVGEFAGSAEFERAAQFFIEGLDEADKLLMITNLRRVWSYWQDDYPNRPPDELKIYKFACKGGRLDQTERAALWRQEEETNKLVQLQVTYGARPSDARSDQGYWSAVWAKTGLPKPKSMPKPKRGA